MYPTKEEILKEPRPQFKSGLLSTVSKWKRGFYEGWADKPEKEKGDDLYDLGVMISALYKKIPPGLYVGARWATRYDPNNVAIFLADASIISFLHELAHHLFGKDELTACRWSVWLYQLRFRNDYKKLVWDEHLLVRRSSRRATGKLRSKTRAASSALPVKRKGGK